MKHQLLAKLLFCSAFLFAPVVFSAQTTMNQPLPMTPEAAWQQFLDQLKSAGQRVVETTEGESDIDRLEGFRLLARMTASGFERFLEHNTSTPAEFFEIQGPTRKYAGDNPDQRYHAIPIDGSKTYRIRGQRGNSVLLELGVYGGNLSFADGKTDGSGQRRLVAFLDESQIKFESDGSFEIILSAEKYPGNWVELTPDSANVLMRSYFKDPRNKDINLSIEALNEDGPAKPLDQQTLAAALLGAGLFVDTTAKVWGGWMDVVAQRSDNTLMPLADNGDLLTPGGIKYHQGYWNLKADEALIIEFDSVQVPYWGFITMNRWMESLEWRDRIVNLNNFNTTVSADGKVRIIVAHQDPGLPNWIDTAGHDQGLMSTRFARLKGALPEATTRLVKFKELKSALAH